MGMEMENIPRCKSNLKIGEGIAGVTETQAPSLRKSIVIPSGVGESRRHAKTEDHTNHINDASNSGNSSGSSDDGGDNSSSKSKSSSGGNHPVGLRILIHRSQKESNIVNKFMFINQTSPPSPTISSFLKACHLCKKQLSPNKDIYMYRGDQGFCSVECRCRQMLMDEYEEMEERCLRERNRRKRLQSPSPQCRRGNRIRETTRPTKGIPALA
ncbi:protein MARD1-like protein [Cinnamomum micranthum f. kanehirae]|uniref:Protein MARD1-like protein n=1 Tax=Cinnamomum micranthum f. kanehirae TaxID=337451 RepID=A0A3S3Q4Y2_9MAGN|nr:protein MARD1-like protein [Cinnamomum micranthum f. kanehirae]